MARWFTADLHLGHANIIRYCGRPFGSVEEMDEALVAGWNEVVRPEDEVWVLGDVAMGRMEDSLPLVGRLTGHKHLVTGNHDRCWAGTHGRSAARIAEWRDRYHEVGFETIVDGTVELLLGGRPVRACHFPYRGDSHEHDRFVEHRPADDGRTWLLHGHVHGAWRVAERMVNVGVDVWGHRPVAEDRLVALIASSR